MKSTWGSIQVTPEMIDGCGRRREVTIDLLFINEKRDGFERFS